MYRVQQLGKRDVAMHWQRHKTGAAHWREMAERGEKMPVCIVVGADPASMYSASAPLPPNIDEFIFAGFLRRAPVKLAKAVTCDLEVPADAEIVIEGYIDPAEALVVEGPFGDHTGYYSEADLYPRVHVTAVTMRKQRRVLPHHRRAPADGGLLPRARHRADLPAAAQAHHAGDRGLPHAGRGRVPQPRVRLSDKQYPGQAYKVMNALWGAGLMSLAKVLVVVDKWVNVRNPQEAWWVALNNIDPERDTRFTMGPVDVLDHASRASRTAARWASTPRRSGPRRASRASGPKVIEMDAATKAKRVDALWPSLGLPARRRGTRRVVPPHRARGRPSRGRRGSCAGRAS
jgi:4-hydroxy-3-polyprenylbenzoate decarboxylase